MTLFKVIGADSYELVVIFITFLRVKTNAGMLLMMMTVSMKTPDASRNFRRSHEAPAVAVDADEG